MPFTFEICMAVRRADKELCGRVNRVIASRRTEVAAILKGYGVPLLEMLPPKPMRHDDD